MLIEVCPSYTGRNCKEKFNYCIATEVKKNGIVVELLPCPFHREPSQCGLDHGLIGSHKRGYPAEMKIYEKKDGKLTELSPMSRLQIIHLD